MLEYYSPESVGVMAMIYTTITILVAIRCFFFVAKKVKAAWRSGFGPGSELARAAVGQRTEVEPAPGSEQTGVSVPPTARASVGASAEVEPAPSSAPVPLTARVVAAWLALLWTGSLAAGVSLLWPVIFMPIFAFAFFLPIWFNMAVGMLVLLGLWSLRGAIWSAIPWKKAN